MHTGTHSQASRVGLFPIGYETRIPWCSQFVKCSRNLIYGFVVFVMVGDFRPFLGGFMHTLNYNNKKYLKKSLQTCLLVTEDKQLQVWRVWNRFNNLCRCSRCFAPVIQPIRGGQSRSIWSVRGRAGVRVWSLMLLVPREKVGHFMAL